MSRYLTCFLVIGLLAGAAPAAVSFDWAEVATGIGPGNLYNCYDLNVTVDTNIALVEMYILADSPAGNDFYHDLGSPGTGYDTYITFPVAYDDDIGEAIDIVDGERDLSFSSLFLDIAWGAQGGASSGSGTFQVARVTVKDGLDGTWQVYGLETGPEPLPEYSASGTSPLYNFTAAPGDFNDDAVLDALDIDLLRIDINTPSGDPKFDVDGSTVVDGDDLIYWVESLKFTKLGDVDLDLKVDGLDATLLGGNWQQTPRGWADGNLNADDIVDGLDATLLGGNWQWGVPPEPVSAPEPGTIGLLVLGLAAVICKRKSSK